MSRADFGLRVARALNVRHARTCGANSAADGSRLQATLIRQDVAEHVMKSPIIRDDALLVVLQFRDWPTRYLGRGGRQMPPRPRYRVGQSHTPLADVTVRNAFSGMHHMERVLRRIIGLTPSTWRRAARHSQ